MGRDWLPWAVNGGAVGILFWVARLYFGGKVIPKIIVDELVKSEHQRAEDFKIAHANSEEARKVLNRQLEEILTTVRATGALLAADHVQPTKRESV